ncbi:MAG: aminopeptidase [Candidatus Thalassarchaeaceae archaeon]|nr:aminopeptidase [Candidatus Thalassarchaeaceae archaeon]
MSGELGSDVGDSEEYAESMLTSARSVIRTCLQVRPFEPVLIVTDPDSSTIGRALYEAAAEVTDRTLMMMMPTSHKKGSEPPDYVAELMRKQDVVILATKSSLTHTKARINASRTGRTRIISMPGISELMFSSGGMTADYNALQKEISGFTSIFRRKRDVRVTSVGGTDITFSIGAKWRTDDNGICNRPGQVMNLPSGRVFVFPKEDSMNGKIVIDGSWEGHLLEEPISMDIENGVIVNMSNNQLGGEISAIFDEIGKSLNKSKAGIVKTVAEFGFGMNSRAKVVGNLLEDQVVRGAAHFVFGDNSAYGGKNNIGLQMRGVVLKPNIELQDIDLVKEGKIIARRK